MKITGADPISLLGYGQELISTPLTEGAANGADDLNTAQRSVTIGEVIPIVFCRRVGDIGGVLISPGATEARFENNLANEVTASYHLVLSEGRLGGIQVRDVFQRSCRVGSFSQTYSRRAGPWIPGNFIVPRAGFTKPECPYYCGTGGTYEGMTTVSYVIADVPDGDTRWDRQVHFFIRDGMEVTRLLDATLGPSNNYADLSKYLLENISRIPTALIDNASLLAVASFTENLGLWVNGEFNVSGNLDDFFATTGPDFLVRKVRRGGKVGLRPMLPVTVGNEIDTSPITPVYVFTENHIRPGSLEISFIPLTERKPFCALMLWRQQPVDDIGLIRTTEVRYAGTATDGPFEQHDLSVYGASENHAVKSGALRLARRRHISHTARVRLRPGSYSNTLVEGDIVGILHRRTPSSGANGIHSYMYEVKAIAKMRSGELALELVHFPVNDAGQSLVALDVVAATGGGIILDTGKSGVSCDVNSDSDTTVPADDSLDPGDWTLPGDDAFDAIIPDPGYGTGDADDGDASFDGGGEFGSGDGGDGEELDTQEEAPPLEAPPIRVPIEGPVPGETLLAPNPCGGDTPTIIQWFRNGVQIFGEVSNGLVLGTIDVGTAITVRIVCPGDGQSYVSPPVNIVADPADSGAWNLWIQGTGSFGSDPPGCTATFYDSYFGSPTSIVPPLTATYASGSNPSGAECDPDFLDVTVDIPGLGSRTFGGITGIAPTLKPYLRRHPS